MHKSWQSICSFFGVANTNVFRRQWQTLIKCLVYFSPSSLPKKCLISLINACEMSEYLLKLWSIWIIMFLINNIQPSKDIKNVSNLEVVFKLLYYSRIIKWNCGLHLYFKKPAFLLGQNFCRKTFVTTRKNENYTAIQSYCFKGECLW